MSSFSRLPRKQRQLADFLILYPEFLEELQQGGLEDVVSEPAVSEIISCLQQLTKDGLFMPEQLLSMLSGKMERQYIADLLMRGPIEGSEHELKGRELCDELLAWLKTVQRRQDGADLQEQISEAQQAGDTELLLELLRKKQEVIKKNAINVDNLLKKV